MRWRIREVHEITRMEDLRRRKRDMECRFEMEREGDGVCSCFREREREETKMLMEGVHVLLMKFVNGVH